VKLGIVYLYIPYIGIYLRYIPDRIAVFPMFNTMSKIFKQASK